MPRKATTKSPAVSPLPLPTARAQWADNPDRMIQLRALVSDPVMQLALATLLESARPTQRGVELAGANAGALLGWYAGYCDAIKDLRFALTTPPSNPQATGIGMPESPIDDSEPWAYLTY